jgi:hypothetical protein
MHRRRIPHVLVALAAAAALLVPIAPAVATPAQAGPTSEAPWTGTDRTWLGGPRAETPEDRYAMAGGCYAIKAPDGRYVRRGGKTYVARAADRASAEPFHFQATDLGSYLLYGTTGDFVSATEGLAATAAYAGTQSTPGAMAGGLALEQTDRAADEVARSPVNDAAGRGDGIVQARTPSELTDWEIRDAGPGEFTITLPATKQGLAAGEDGILVLVAPDQATKFAFELTAGCASYPEVEINVEGPVVGGQTTFQEVRGYFDAHLHMMAYEFLGGRARCGRPWHRYGVQYALVDCPDHEPGGRGAVLEQVLTKKNPGTEHDTTGWPSFTGWPTYNSLTHEQVYYKWLERSWRGGLRMFVNLLVDNNQLCKIYPYKRNSCNEMDGVRLQARRIRELERYIDAQSGGPGEGWFRIVTDPFEARRVINEGKLAVVLGIEVSVPLDCGETLEVPRCDEAAIDRGLDEVYDLGVRQMELVNKFDNAFSGVAGDSGDTGLVVNQGNLGETGHYWKMDTCTEADGSAHDKTQHNFHDQSGAPDDFTGRDALAGGIFGIFGASGAAPIYPEGPHCNVRGLTDLGEKMIRGMARRGMIFDPDHMSARAQTQALNLVESMGYSGIVSSHGWSNDTIYPRIYKLGGMITPYAGGSGGFVNEWMKSKAWADGRYYFGFGYGSDMNGFGSQGAPRRGPNPVEYPFTGLGGATIGQQQSGTRTYDVNTDGVAHYGLYPDWIEDLRRIAGEEIVEDMARGSEAYLQTWERAIGIAPDACRPDVPDLTKADLGRLRTGMTPREVLSAIGQPGVRSGSTFTYCIEGGGTATFRFTEDDRLFSTKYAKTPPATP